MGQRSAAGVKEQAHKTQQHHQQRIDGQHLDLGLLHELLRGVHRRVHQGRCLSRQVCGGLPGPLKHPGQARLQQLRYHCLAHSVAEATRPASA